MIITGDNDGVAFSVRSTKGSVPPAQLTFNDAVLENGTYSVNNGTPTANAVPVGQTSNTFPITITTVNANGCNNAIEIAQIKVNSLSTVTVTSVSSTLNQIVCDNTNIDNIDFTIGGGATFAVVDGLPTGVQLNNVGGNNFRISFVSSLGNVTPTTFSFTVTTTGNANGCDEASFTGTIIVNPDDDISLTSAPGTDDQTVCEGSTNALSAINTIHIYPVRWCPVS